MITNCIKCGLPKKGDGFDYCFNCNPLRQKDNVIKNFNKNEFIENKILKYFDDFNIDLKNQAIIIQDLNEIIHLKCNQA